jgi:heme/copper-type cytochrome/quinol oxidase subunit 2
MLFAWRREGVDLRKRQVLLTRRRLVARPGEIVLTIVNSARHAHTFSFPSLGVEGVVLPGSATHPSITVIHFRARYGTFPWYCKLPCGKSMSGDLYISRSVHRVLFGRPHSDGGDRGLRSLGKTLRTTDAFRIS